MREWHEQNADDQEGPNQPECKAKDLVATHIGNCIRTISASSPYSQHDRGNCQKDFLVEALKKDPACPQRAHTLQALKGLKVRDTIVIVAVVFKNWLAGDQMYRDLREAIAPIDQWSEKCLRVWPEITLTKEQGQNVHNLLYMLPIESEIRLWHFQPPSSKALVLPAHELYTDAHFSYNSISRFKGLDGFNGYDHCYKYDTNDSEPGYGGPIPDSEPEDEDSDWESTSATEEEQWDEYEEQ